MAAVRTTPYVASHRRLRVFALDPSFSSQLDAAALNEMAVSIRWEKSLQRGPVGEYFEVHDPRHRPVDLNAPTLLAQDGLAPAVGNAQFHQQMVYAVAMKVVENVERALGRVLLWNPKPEDLRTSATRSDANSQLRLRLIPHAMKEANAYYSPEDRALVFGYFPAKQFDESLPAGETIYTCLSHDIIAHELTHVVIHSLLPLSVASLSLENMAFHEAVSDLTAILQHFELSPLVDDVVRRTRGDLSKEHQLAQLAVEFGKALTAEKRALRSALGGDPDINALAKADEPHSRGAIMVAAVFDAFLALYRQRVAPLLRIATNGTGELPPGDPHPDLVKRMSGEATATARRMLNLVLRALDYCPPVDITFSDYLRALVTADNEHASDDRTFRIAICEAFRRRGIAARDTRGISVDAIRWPSSRLGFFVPDVSFLNKFSDCWRHGASRQAIHSETTELMRAYWSWLQSIPLTRRQQKELGIVLPATGRQRLRVHALRPTRRITQGHELNLDWVIQITQRSKQTPSFYGGCTLIVDADTGHVRYAIAKDVRDSVRFEQQQLALNSPDAATPQKTIPRRRSGLRRVVEPVVTRQLPTPPCRRLRTYAFDPTLSWELDTAVLNQTTLNIKWEDLKRGPVGEFVEVIDYDPASKAFYPGVDLNDQGLLAQDGIAPSEGSPQFHQQMVYAVAMNTIAHFERALGRAVLWSPQQQRKRKGRLRSPFVRRLRLYPHALRQPNAYYDTDKKAILFGYFPASPADPGRNLPGGMVFTCLSQDIIAHETTHAILDGIHCRYLEPTNPDALAFHEAFADIVALFQHFSHAEALSHQIAKTRGDLTRQNLLGELAQQFGEATGRYGALRSAIGQVNPSTQQWEPIQADPAALERAAEAHQRGAILVAAVFDAFLTIYKARVTDLIRIATEGTGKLREGDIHPDLVARLSAEAGKAAGHVLQMCIRALDYCPPFDVTFGEFLRAMITADYDLLPEDPRSYRIAVIEAFRRRGIHPSDVRTLSQDSLRWSSTDLNLHELDRSKGKGLFDQVVTGWRLQEDRRVIFERMSKLRRVLKQIIRAAHLTENQQRELGIALGRHAQGVVKFNRKGEAEFEVHSLRRARRISPDGRLKVDLVIELTQTHKSPYPKGEPQWPAFRGGCALIADPDTGQVRYCVSKDIRSVVRLERQRVFLNSLQALPLQAAYFGDPRRQPSTAGLLAMLHEGEMQ